MFSKDTLKNNAELIGLGTLALIFLAAAYSPDIAGVASAAEGAEASSVSDSSLNSWVIAVTSGVFFSWLLFSDLGKPQHNSQVA
jgi:hypothetical protein